MLKAMIYDITDKSEINMELLSSLNDEETKALKSKAALVNYIKSFIKSKSKWANVTDCVFGIEVTTNENVDIVASVAMKKKTVKPFKFNAIVVYEETAEGLKLYNVQIFDDIKITATSGISNITITISTGE